MTPVQVFGLICGFIALFFAFVAGLTLFKIKKLFSLIDESQYEQVMPFVEKQRKRVYIETLLSALFTVITVILAVVNSL